MTMNWDVSHSGKGIVSWNNQHYKFVISGETNPFEGDFNIEYVSAGDDHQGNPSIIVTLQDGNAMRVGKNGNQDIQPPSGKQLKKTLEQNGGGKVYALTSDGLMYELDFQNKWYPIPIEGGEKIVDFDRGLVNFVLMLSDKYHVFSYGQGTNDRGGVGLSCIDPPKKVSIPEDNIKSINCGNYHCLVLYNNKSLYGWGYNGHNELDSENCFNRSPFKLKQQNVDEIACSGYNSGILIGTDLKVIGSASCSWVSNVTQISSTRHNETIVAYINGNPHSVQSNEAHIPMENLKL